MIIGQRFKELNKMEAWAASNSLSFNPSKSKIMAFSRKRNVKHPKLYLNNTELEYVTEIKYLGVTIDQRLKWTKHLETQTKKAMIALAQGRKMIGRRWGLKPKYTHWLYTSIVRPIVTYGAVVWAHSTERKTITKKLEKVQRLACLMITGGMKSTPTKGMETILNLPPLHIHAKGVARATYVRLTQAGTWRPKEGEPLWRNGHAIELQKWGTKNQEIHMPQDRLHKAVRSSTTYRTEIKKREEIKKQRPMPNDEKTIHCYTDGSKLKNARAGFFIIGTETRRYSTIHLDEGVTVFQAEIIAIIEAAKELIQKNLREYHIKFYTDSQSAIKAAQKYCVRSKLVQECKEVLNTLANQNTVTLEWVPGHEGHMGNEVADRLAKRGTDQQNHGPSPFAPRTNGTTVNVIKKWERKQHNTEWKAISQCRQTKLLLPEINENWSREIIRKNRSNIRKLTQILTGHANLKRHRHIMGLEDNAVCEKCNEEEETAEHFIRKCPFFGKIRWETFGRAELSIEDLHKETIRDILLFITRTRRLEETNS